MPILLRYKLECNHGVRALINKPELSEAYRKGMSLQCPQCHYDEKKIIEEEIIEV